MQPQMENQLIIFEDDEDIMEPQAPRDKIEPNTDQRVEPTTTNQDFETGGNQHQHYEAYPSPKFNLVPPSSKEQVECKKEDNQAQKQLSNEPNFVFLQQNAYSFRTNTLQKQQREKPKQFQHELEIISDLNSQMSNNDALMLQSQDEQRKRNSKSRRSRNRSKFQDINDQTSVKSNKFIEKAELFKEGQKIVPNLLNSTPEKQVEVEYHKTQDYLKHEKNDHKEIIQSITALNKSKNPDKILPPLKHQKSNQIFINTSGILQNQTSMFVLNKKQDQKKKQVPNMSSISQLLNTSQCEKIKKIAQKVVPLTKTLKCSFNRQKKCCLNYWHPVYSFSLKQEKTIINSRKRFGTLNSYYDISSEQKIFDETSQKYMGYLSGNFVGTCFNLYQKQNDLQELVCTISYETELTCSSSFRKIQIFVKNDRYRTEQLFREDNQREANLKQLYYLGQNAQQKKIVKLINKKPEWNQAYNCYSLNFKGKCKMPSVKNSVFIEEDEPNRYVLMCCKINQNEFHTEISHPLSPFTAMGIILSSFDFKLFCQ